jgi:PAS domain S-box-containing protein
MSEPRPRPVRRATGSRRLDEGALRSLVEGCPWAAVVLGEDGSVAWAGPALERLLGFTAEEVAGRALRELVHPRDQALLGDRVSLAPQGTLLRLRQRGGGWRVCEVCPAAPAAGAGGESGGAVLWVRPTGPLDGQPARQDRLREVLNRAAKEWQLTFDSIESPILLVDGEGRLRRLNRAAMQLSGATYQACLGRRVEEIGPGQPWRAAGELAAAARAARSALSRQVLAGDGRTWDLAASLVRIPFDPEERVIVVAREITEIVRLQESLRTSELMSAMGALVGGVAHEVRNPLFGISAALDAFDECFGGHAEYREYIDVLRSQVDRLSELMRELLEYGKPPATTLLPGPLGEVLVEGLDTCASLAARAEVGLVRRVADPLPPVPMDRGRLVQVFHNLVENAVQHSPRGGRVEVEAAAAGGWIVCAVKDSGPGFRDGDLGRLFEPFFSRRTGGTGLGLSIVHRIVDEHGGRITAANRPEGGAVLTLWLPAAPRQ